MIGMLILHKTEQDCFLLSKGHAATALYSCLHHLGEITDEQLRTFYKDGTDLPAHPEPGKFKSVPFATGSLGHGFSLGAGIAKAKKLRADNSFVHVLLSDGETNEGATWEAAHFAVSHKLDNLIVAVDKNGLQGFGQTAEVLGDTSSEAKWKSLGFETIVINGHDPIEIGGAILTCRKRNNGVPKVILANTVKGKGVSFMESKMEWHYLPMTSEQNNLAIQEIKRRYRA